MYALPEASFFLNRVRKGKTFPVSLEMNRMFYFQLGSVVTLSPYKRSRLGAALRTQQVIMTAKISKSPLDNNGEDRTVALDVFKAIDRV